MRILCAPVFLWMLLADGGADGPLRWWAAVLFIVAIATDGIDGWLARRYDIVTDLGKLLDPIADKVLTGFAFIGLSILGELPWWITIVVLIREVGITVHRLIVASDHVVAAAWMGKLKTLAQAVALSLALLPLWTLVGDWIFWVNGVTMTIAVRPDDRERHRLRRHRGARRAQRAGGTRDVTRSARAAAVLGRGCARRGGWTIGIAESLTGGLVVAALVSVPGASAQRARRESSRTRPTSRRSLLGVDADLLAARGPGATRRSRGRWPQGVRRARCGGGRRHRDDGVAGPDPQDGQPVGTVHIAVVDARRARGVDVAARSRDRATQIRARRPRARDSLSRLEAS